MKATDNLLQNIRLLLLDSKKRMVRQVHQTMTITYFQIGRYIVDFEQAGNERAVYSKKTMENLSNQLSKEFGRGFSTRNLEQMRQFYLTYRNQIPQTLSAEFESLFLLSWSHYVFLMRLQPIELRQFYEIETSQNQWSLRELKRQFNSSLYKRLALSRDKEDAVIEYTLPEDNEQIFASQYQLVLPDKEQLKQLLQQSSQKKKL